MGYTLRHSIQFGQVTMRLKRMGEKCSQDTDILVGAGGGWSVYGIMKKAVQPVIRDKKGP